MEEPHHPILDQPWSWEISSIEWRAGGEGWPAHLDVTFVREGVVRRLRFTDPENVHIKLGGQLSVQCGEMVILDIRGRQLNGLTVEVTEGGASGSPLHLYARSVTEIASEQ